MKKIILAGEMFSTNLGDRLIYDNFRYLFQCCAPAHQVEPLDISGRGPAPALPASLEQRLALIRFAENRSPALFSILNGAVQYWLTHKRIRKQWAPLLQNASGLVIGGGHLLQDNQLGFPVKLYCLAQAARQIGLPVFVSACGVGGRWSRAAHRLFSTVLVGARSISLRDPLSQQHLKEFLPQVETTVTFDPAVWSGEVYEKTQVPPEAQVIGLGVVSHQDINLHLEKEQRFSLQSWLQFWSDLIHELYAAGIRFEIFTNGSPLDQQFAELLAQRMRQVSIDCALAERPSSPLDLVKTISCYRGVIATRLHASILANAHQIPSIGLVWDEKVRTYYDRLGYAERCLDMRGAKPGMILKNLQSAGEQGFNPATLSQAKTAALKNIEIILQAL